MDTSHYAAPLKSAPKTGRRSTKARRISRGAYQRHRSTLSRLYDGFNLSRARKDTIA
jgi:hypothetical protein